MLSNSHVWCLSSTVTCKHSMILTFIIITTVTIPGSQEGKGEKRKSWLDFCHGAWTLTFLSLMTVVFYENWPRKHQGSAFIVLFRICHRFNLERKVRLPRAEPVIRRPGISVRESAADSSLLWRISQQGTWKRGPHDWLCWLLQRIKTCI